MKYALLLASIISGLIIWFGLSKYEASLEQKYLAKESAAPTTFIYVYASDINFGEPLSETMLVAQERLITSLPNDYVAFSESTKTEVLSQFLGKKLARDVKQFDSLREKDFVAQQNRSLSASLETGTRAVAIKVSAEKIAGGFVLPGDRVDLIATISKDFNGDGKATAKSYTFLKNVKVLAIGQDASVGRIPDGGIALPGDTGETKTEAKLGSTITLQLDTPQVELLTAASHVAMLSVALRRPSDQFETSLGDVTFLQDGTQSSSTKSVSHSSSKAEPRTEKMQLTVLNGDKATVFTFDK